MPKDADPHWPLMRWTLTTLLVAGVTAAPKLASASLTIAGIAPGLLLGAGLAVLTVIDLKTYRLPNVLTVGLAAAGLAVAVLTQREQAAWHLLAAVIGYGTLYAVAAFYRYQKQRDGLGLGDVKLFAASGAWLGLEGLPTVLLLASGTAIAGAVAAMLAGYDVKGATRIPFGPFLAFGTWVVWLYGPLV